MQDEGKTKEHLLAEVHELRERISGLQKERVDHEQAEEALHVNNARLADRVKELDCLHELARIVEVHGISLECILEQTVRLIPSRFQCSGTICARIMLEGRQYTTDNYQTTARRVSRELVVEGHSVGALDVCFLDDRAGIAPPSFSSDEESFLWVIVERLQRVIERMWLAEDLRCERARLEALWSLNSLADADNKAISDHTLKAITEMTRSQFGFYGFLNSDESVMSIHSWSGNAMKACSIVDKPGDYPIANSGVWAEAVRRGEPLILNDYSGEHPAKKGLPEGHVPLTNLLVVPFFSKGKITTVAAVANRLLDYTQDDVTQISTFLKSIDGIVNSKRAEDAVRESERRLHRAEIVAQLGNWEFIIDTGRFRLSEGASVIYGLEGSIWSMPELQRVLLPEYRPILDKALKGLVEEGKPFHVDFKILRPTDGKIIDIHSIAEYISRKGAVFGIVQDVTERKRMEEELRKSQADLEMRVRERTAELEDANRLLRNIPSRLITAQEEERKRLASELHDSVGQTLAALKFRIEHILFTFRQSKTKETLRFVEEFVPLLQRSIDETRSIYMGLRPRVLEDFGVTAALLWYRDELLRLHPEQHIELNIGIQENEISASLVVPIFRIAQEALNNATKHSKAEWVDVSLSRDKSGIELIISDDGQGMDVDYIIQSNTSRSLGLIGMRERAELTGGKFWIESTPAEGTTVRVFWPISQLC